MNYQIPPGLAQPRWGPSRRFRMCAKQGDSFPGDNRGQVSQLAVLIHQGNQGDRSTENIRGEPGETFKGSFRERVQDIVAAQSLKSLLFLRGKPCSFIGGRPLGR